MRSNYGLTGDIASGKSTVSRYLMKKGFTIVDADKIAREVVVPGEEGYLRLRKAFPNAFNEEMLDRQKLASIIYADPKERKRLNELLHPLIFKRMLKQAEGKVSFFDAPLLFEVGLDAHCKKILYVGVDSEVRLKRLMERDGLNMNEARKKMDAFDYPREEKIAKSIYIDNNGTKEELYKQINAFLKEEGLLNNEEKEA